jgi:hypothetical protein
MLRQEEAIFEAGYIHAIWNLDHVYRALVTFDAEFESPVSFY